MLSRCLIHPQHCGSGTPAAIMQRYDWSDSVPVECDYIRVVVPHRNFPIACGSGVTRCYRGFVRSDAVSSCHVVPLFLEPRDLVWGSGSGANAWLAPDSEPLTLDYGPDHLCWLTVVISE